MSIRIKSKNGEDAFVPPSPPPANAAESDIKNLNRRLIDAENAVSRLMIEISVIRKNLDQRSRNFAFVFSMLTASIVTLATVLAFILHFK